MRFGRRGLLFDAVGVFLAREVRLFLPEIDSAKSAMSHHWITLSDLCRLRERFLLVATHEAWRQEIEIDETHARIEEIRIELDGALEFIARLHGQSRLLEQAGL